MKFDQLKIIFREVKMKRNNAGIFFAVIVVLLLFSLPLAGCTGAGTSGVTAAQAASAGTTMAEMTTAAGAAADTTASAATIAGNSVQVICKNNKFQPDSLTIKVGTTVTWVNQDGYIHTATSGKSPDAPSGVFDSGKINAGGTFSFTFDKAGTYDYFCIPHFSLGMIGVITVTQ
jgi:plastocyanin